MGVNSARQGHLAVYVLPGPGLGSLACSINGQTGPSEDRFELIRQTISSGRGNEVPGTRAM